MPYAVGITREVNMDASEMYLKIKAMSPEQRLEYIAQETKKFHQQFDKSKEAGEGVLQAIKDVISDAIEDYHDDYLDNYQGALLEDYWELISDSDEFRKALKEYVRWLI